MAELEADPERLRCVANDQLLLILMPTEACNFRCTYCYEDFRYQQMEPWVVEGVKRFISIRAPELRVLQISWFGGEPLLAMSVIDDVSQHVQATLSDHPDMRAKCSMTTNGYLLSPQRFAHLLDLGVTEYQVSLDGPREHHNRKRVLTGGRGTFDDIWNNLLAMRDAAGEFHIVLRLHVDRDNRTVIPALLRDIAAHFRADSRFELFIRTVGRLGGPNDADLPVLDEAEGREAVRELAGMAADLGLQHTTLEKHTPVCYASRANSYVVRSNGRLNKCTVALEHPANQVGMLRPDGRLDIEMPRLQPWIRGVWSNKREELECPMRGYADT